MLIFEKYIPNYYKVMRTFYVYHTPVYWIFEHFFFISLKLENFIGVYYMFFNYMLHTKNGCSIDIIEILTQNN